jgi:hypothetical protein
LKEAARDCLVEIIGQEPFPETLKQPEIKPQVLLDEVFDPFDPLSIWRHFITVEDCAYIASQSNVDARINQQNATKPRPWKDVSTAEISAYLGALFVLGTQGASKLVKNWFCSEYSPLFPFRNHISLVRFQEISRYLKINTPGEAIIILSDEEFWHNVDPLVLSFRQRCRANLQPGSIFTIDE